MAGPRHRFTCRFKKKSVFKRKMKLQGTKSVSSRHRFTCRFFKKQKLTRKAYFIDHEQGNDMLHQHSFAPFKAGGAGKHTKAQREAQCVLG